MDDRQTDMTFFASICNSSGVDHFSNDIRELLLVVIKEICDTHAGLIQNLRIEHIDRAISKYVQAKKKRQIWNTKQYFKECILSAIREVGLEERYHD